MRFALMTVALGAIGACSSAASTEIQSGRYSGSTRDDAAITIDVGGSEIRVNNREATLVRVDDNRRFVADRLPGKPKFSCEPVAKGEELRCSVKWQDHSETIELMRE